MIIKDNLLHPRWIEIEKHNVILYEPKDHKSKEGLTYTKDHIIGFFSTVEGAIKRVIRDRNIADKSTVDLKGYVEIITREFNSLKQVLS